MTKIDRSADIENYQAAYLKANGNFPYEMTYESGWYVLKQNGFTYFKKRRAEILDMTDRLNFRAKEKANA